MQYAVRSTQYAIRSTQYAVRSGLTGPIRNTQYAGQPTTSAPGPLRNAQCAIHNTPTTSQKRFQYAIPIRACLKIRSHPIRSVYRMQHISYRRSCRGRARRAARPSRAPTYGSVESRLISSSGVSFCWSTHYSARTRSWLPCACVCECVSLTHSHQPVFSRTDTPCESTLSPLSLSTLSPYITTFTKSYMYRYTPSVVQHTTSIMNQHSRSVFIYIL